MTLSLDLTVEQHKILYAKKKDGVVTKVIPLTEFGLEQPQMPPIEFPRIETTQTKVEEYEKN